MTEGKALPSKTRSALYYGYNVVAVAFLIMLLAYGVRTSFGVFFKPMLEEFDWTRAFTSGAVTLSMIVQGVWGIYMGRVNDRIGGRLIITICSLLLGLGLFLTSITHYSWQLYVFYGLIIGLGMGGVFVALMSTVTRWFVKNRGLMSGIVLAGVGAGTIILAPVSSWLISAYGWRESNVIVAIAVAVLGVAAAQFLRRDPAEMGLAAYGAGWGESGKPPSALSGLTLKEAMRRSQLWMAVLAFTSLGYCLFTVTIHLAPHATDMGISSGAAAAILGVTGAVESIGGIIFGMAADRIGNRRVFLVGMAMGAAGLFWLGFLTSALALYIFAVLYGLGIGAAAAMESTITAELFGMRSHGVLLGVMSFGFTIGGAVGPVVTGFLFDLRKSYDLAFLICGGVGVLGMLLILLVRPVPGAARTG
jgi:MFS family permease